MARVISNKLPTKAVAKEVRGGSKQPRGGMQALILIVFLLFFISLLTDSQACSSCSTVWSDL